MNRSIIWTPAGPPPTLFGEVGQVFAPQDPEACEPCVFFWKRDRYEVEVFERPYPEAEQRSRRREGRVLWSFTVANDGEESTFTPAGSWESAQDAAREAERVVEQRLAREIAEIRSTRRPAS